MINEFPRIITLLRKEKGISQKQAANDLEISQALLSHYEKGIRECGLDFLVKTSKYYNVSCDYLLGLSPQRNGNVITADEIPDPQTQVAKHSSLKGSLMAGLNKKLLQNSITVIYDLLTKTGSNSLISDATDYLFINVYNVFRLIYDINSDNNTEIFKINKINYSAFASAESAILKAKMDGTISSKKEKLNIDELIITTESLSKDYPLYASSLLNLIQNAENRLKSIK